MEYEEVEAICNKLVAEGHYIITNKLVMENYHDGDIDNLSLYVHLWKKAHKDAIIIAKESEFDDYEEEE